MDQATITAAIAIWAHFAALAFDPCLLVAGSRGGGESVPPPHRDIRAAAGARSADGAGVGPKHLGTTGGAAVTEFSTHGVLGSTHRVLGPEHLGKTGGAAVTECRGR